MIVCLLTFMFEANSVKFTSLFSSIGHGSDSLDGFFLLSRVDPYLIPHFSCFYVFMFFKGII